jgi:antitoxin component HigA of HigAB toxin-antitoxin module
MSLENITTEIADIPTLYLGNDTTVTGNTWNFSNAQVYLNVEPTTGNMITNKSYVDNLVNIQEKKIDTILDGASVSVENFKNFVDFVNQSQRENESELYASINDISLAIIDEGVRAKDSESEIKKTIETEVSRAIEVENGILNQIDDIRNQLEGGKASEQVKELIDNEIERATSVENKFEVSITEIRANLQLETNRSIDAINSIESTMDEVKSSVQNEYNRAIEEETSIKQTIEELRGLITKSNVPEGLDTIINEEKDRALAVEKTLEEKIDALYFYFFKTNTIPK